MDERTEFDRASPTIRSTMPICASAKALELHSRQDCYFVTRRAAFRTRNGRARGPSRAAIVIQRVLRFVSIAARPESAPYHFGWIFVRIKIENSTICTTFFPLSKIFKNLHLPPCAAHASFDILYTRSPLGAERRSLTVGG